MGPLSPDHALLLHSLCGLCSMQVRCLLLLLPFPGQGSSLYCSTCGWQSQANGAFSPFCLHHRRFRFSVLCLEWWSTPNCRMRYQKKASALPKKNKGKKERKKKILQDCVSGSFTLLCWKCNRAFYNFAAFKRCWTYWHTCWSLLALQFRRLFIQKRPFLCLYFFSLLLPLVTDLAMLFCSFVYKRKKEEFLPTVTLNGKNSCRQEIAIPGAHTIVSASSQCAPIFLPRVRCLV